VPKPTVHLRWTYEDEEMGTIMRTPSVTPEMLRAAAAAHLSDQRIVLWGRTFDLVNDPMDDAVDWLTRTVIEVLEELST
jgi:hypothetical protein